MPGSCKALLAVFPLLELPEPPGYGLSNILNGFFFGIKQHLLILGHTEYKEVGMILAIVMLCCSRV